MNIFKLTRAKKRDKRSGNNDNFVSVMTNSTREFKDDVEVSDPPPVLLSIPAIISDS